MFHKIPRPVRERMAYLEAVDARDREDGTPKERRLRQVPPVTGRFLALLAASAPPGKVIEIGTSGGYSSLWLSLACRERGDRLTTFEMDENKAGIARETFAAAGVEALVEFVQADALECLPELAQIAFCFMDAEKTFYPKTFELVVQRLIPGGVFVADNLLSHEEELRTFVSMATADERVDAMIVPVGKGLLVCRRPLA